MNFRKDLKINLQKLNLAIAEIIDCEFDTDKQRNLKLKFYQEFKNDTNLKSINFNLNYLSYS